MFIKNLDQSTTRGHRPLNLFNAEEVHAVMGWVVAFGYEDTQRFCADAFGAYLPKDQYNALNEALNIQMDLDIGHRRDEWFIGPVQPPQTQTITFNLGA